MFSYPLLSLTAWQLRESSRGIFRRGSALFFEVDIGLRAKDVHTCCFSERIDSSVVWAHYGTNHTGCCVSYDFTVPADAKNMFPIYYDFISYSAIDPKLGDEPASDHYPLLFKDNDWSYEREWRLIHYDLLQLNAGSQLLKMAQSMAISTGALCTTEQLMYFTSRQTYWMCPYI